jgi:hypothetical protein
VVFLCRRKIGELRFGGRRFCHRSQEQPFSEGICLSPVQSSVVITIGSNGTATFAIFLNGSGNIAFDPANNRVFVRFQDAGGVTRGSTSVAVRTL